MNRYTLYIHFKGYFNKSIVQPFKTLKEAKSYSTMIDDTVLKAHITDKCKGDTIVEVLK